MSAILGSARLVARESVSHPSAIILAGPLLDAGPEDIVEGRFLRQNKVVVSFWIGIGLHMPRVEL